MHNSIPRETEDLAKRVINAAFRVHKNLGPGLLESVYESCLCHELTKEGISFQRQLDFPIHYDGFRLDTGLRIDVLVDEKLIVELKAVEAIIPLHRAQVLTYLKLTNLRLALLLNFNVELLKDGLSRIVL